MHFQWGLKIPWQGKKIFCNYLSWNLYNSWWRSETFQRGDNRNKARKVPKLILRGETNFLGGSSFYLGGWRFNGVVTWGCVNAWNEIDSFLFHSSLGIVSWHQVVNCHLIRSKCREIYFSLFWYWNYLFIYHIVSLEFFTTRIAYFYLINCQLSCIKRYNYQ